MLNFTREFLSRLPMPPAIIDWNPWLLGCGPEVESRLLHLLAHATTPSSGEAERLPDLSQMSALRASVVSDLTAAADPLVLLIDDVDRLESYERATLVRALLSLAGTPNLVVLLSLTVDDPGDELEGSLDRIAHVSLDLPVPDRAALQGMFVDRIQPLMAEAREGGLVDPEYWTDVCVNGIDQFLRTPRDVVRLVNAVNATFPAVAGEVNPVDFVALETLRLFSPIAYDAVRRNPPAFLLPSHVRRSEDGSLAACQAYHQRWLDRLDEVSRTNSSQLLMRLFPRLPDILGARVMVSQPEDSWRTLLLVCAEEIFPVYFQLSIPTGAISNADLQSRLEFVGDTNQFSATLLELARDSHPDAGARLRAFLQRLEAHISEQVEPDQVAPTFQAVFQAADELLRREQRGEQSFGAQESIRRIVRQLLLRVEAEQRLDELELLIGSGSSIATVVDTVMMLGEQHGKYGGEWREGAETLITLSELARLENLALAAIREEASAGSLVKSPRMPDVLTCWATWNRGECRTWVSREITDDDGLLAFLEPFMNDAGAPSASARGPRVERRLDHRTLRPFLEPSAIVDRVRALAKRDTVSDQHRQLLDRYVLDYELLQQATSADSIDAEPDSFAA